MKTILLATCDMQLRTALPTASDDIALLAALSKRGIRARVAAWNDPAVEWACADLVAIRSTWDYHLHLSQFLTWAERMATLRRLSHPLQVVRWNSNKSYLLELSQQGIPIVPTRWVERDKRADLASIMAEQGWQRIVIKPDVGVNAYGIIEVDLEHIALGQAHLDRLLKKGAALVQPFLSTVARLGERSLVWVAGTFSSQVVCKRLMTRSTASTPGDEQIQEASTEEIQLARRVLNCAIRSLHLEDEALLFARVDMVPDESGQVRLMELELIEPKLYFDLFPHLAEHCAGALLERLEQRDPSSALCPPVPSL